MQSCSGGRLIVLPVLLLLLYEDGGSGAEAEGGGWGRRTEDSSSRHKGKLSLLASRVRVPTYIDATCIHTAYMQGPTWCERTSFVSLGEISGQEKERGKEGRKEHVSVMEDPMQLNPLVRSVQLSMRFAIRPGIGFFPRLGESLVKTSAIFGLNYGAFSSHG